MNPNIFFIKYKTPSRLISLYGNSNCINIDNIKIEKGKFENECKMECRNYEGKWSCPPASPNFKDINDKKFMYIFVLWVYTEEYSDVNLLYTKVKAINSILSSTSLKLGYDLEREFDGILYKSGSCKLCKSCNYPSPCKKPKLRRYSLESVGINVDDLSFKHLNHKLCWYIKGIINDYQYGSVVCGIATNELITHPNMYLKEKMQKFIN